MKRLVWAVGLTVAAGLVVTEAAMRPSARDRAVLAAVYGVAALITVALFWGATRIQPRLRSLQASVQLVAFASVLAATVVVLAAAQTMFLSTHDRNLVLVALVLGVMLGGALAVAVAGSLGRDLAKMRAAAEQVAAGDLRARTGVERVDELGAAASTFDEMVQRLAANEDERRRVLAAIGHDLRAPLASIQAVVEALEDGLEPDAEGAIRGMAHDVSHLGKLIDDLFLLARLEAGRLELHPEPVDLAELADEAVEAMRPLATKADVTVRLDLPGAVPAEVDPWAIGRVLRNLLDNAVRHTPTGGTITVSAGRVAERSWVRVEDTGPGFPPEMVGHGWSPVHVRGGGGGAGLGLAIARGIVEAHAGRIEIEDGSGGRVMVEV